MTYGVFRAHTTQTNLGDISENLEFPDLISKTPTFQQSVGAPDGILILSNEALVSAEDSLVGNCTLSINFKLADGFSYSLLVNPD